LQRRAAMDHTALDALWRKKKELLEQLEALMQGTT
jgi:hypothetical protein